MQCLACQEPIDLTPGSVFHRLQVVSLYLGHSGLEFEEDRFEDGESLKWLCTSCAHERGILTLYLDEEYCTLCSQEFEMEGESDCPDVVVRVEELKIRQNRLGLLAHDCLNVGHVHIMCVVDDWDLPIWNWSLERDVPPCR